MVISGTRPGLLFCGEGGEGGVFRSLRGDSRCILLYSIFILPSASAGKPRTGSTLRAARPRTVYFETGVLRKNVFHV